MKTFSFSLGILLNRSPKGLSWHQLELSPLEINTIYISRMIKIVESQSLRTTWNISSWTYYIIPNLILITVFMLSVTMASQIMFTFEILSTQMSRVFLPPRRSITDIHSRFRGCGVVLNWCSRRCCRWWWWWRRGGKQWVIAVLTFTCFHAAALAIELAEGGPDTGLSPHKLD